MSKSEILSKVSNVTKKRVYEKTKVQKAHLHIKNDGDMVENCLKNLQANKTEVIQCHENEIKEKIDTILKSIQAKRVLCSFDTPFDTDFENIDIVKYEKSVNESYSELFSCDTSIIKAKLAISNLGLFCVTSNDGPRLSSLLPQNCIVLLKKEDIVNSMNDAYEILEKEKIPTNIIFIAGPSRTADIELIVVLGVHGPQKVFAIVY